MSSDIQIVEDAYPELDAVAAIQRGLHTYNQEMGGAYDREPVTLLDAPLGNRAAFASAFAQGLGVTEAVPRSPAAAEMRALAAALRGLARR
jgi:hypothetical protein